MSSKGNLTGLMIDQRLNSTFLDCSRRRRHFMFSLRGLLDGGCADVIEMADADTSVLERSNFYQRNNVHS